jgi:hypothetical protein
MWKLPRQRSESETCDQCLDALLTSTQTERYVGIDTQMREQRIVLKDHADLALLGLDKRFWPGDLIAIYRNAPARWSLYARDGAQERRLTGPRRSQQTNNLATMHVERDLVDRSRRAEVDRQRLYSK